MKWKLKAFAQRAMSAFPNSEELNYLMQRYVTKSVPTREPNLLGKARNGLKHIARMKQAMPGLQLSEANYYEFGAGWDLAIPLVYYMAGMKEQVLVDIAPHLRSSSLQNAFRILNEKHDQLEKMAGRPLRKVPYLEGAEPGMEELEEQFGIRYHAPKDARDTGFPDNTFQLSSNTFTLEHIPPDDILAILRETYRILKPGGLLSCAVDMNYHFWYVDNSISRYNFLTIEDEEWEKYNSSLHYLNRLRFPEYMEIFEQTSFEILDVTPKPPGKKEMDILNNLNLIDRFTDTMTMEEIGITSFWITLRK